MKKVLLLGFVIILTVMMPNAIPNVTVSDTAQNAQYSEATMGTGTSVATAAPSQVMFPIGHSTITISQSGNAYAWNLLADCCQAGSDFCCGIYWEGVEHHWWE